MESLTSRRREEWRNEGEMEGENGHGGEGWNGGTGTQSDISGGYLDVRDAWDGCCTLWALSLRGMNGGLCEGDDRPALDWTGPGTGWLRSGARLTWLDIQLGLDWAGQVWDWTRLARHSAWIGDGLEWYRPCCTWGK